ncbi:multidrug ABC superfamily ATP binding cassette transporter, ABC protein [Secundilactobacillus odoratitofui DSM 19909 = JCM 15043]|uniref:Multidrug ABC superfamily ATP binding cassette transporter, ABC protein n=1 Tax=Secundilactobacillus odoratitofui DSM 19909 = JCM 15043 TaxID=1423776 RepID=A0A0R1LYV0_9LACO|nr:ABC transporter transmembrane domain-containing protein [Secundilactobacillus odoratitofui]KRK98209.1 multidrug ABC superfamily ATP binding cassette transporter, ABC protein [Secundilactobacillus odoratitofui DSM 19909 = JCM 15043]
MSIFKKLGWYFKLEWRTYLFGLLGLLLTAILAIIPPRMIGLIVDAIHGHQLTLKTLLVQLGILAIAAIGQYGSRYMWRTAIWGAAANLEKTLRQRLFKHYMNMDQTFYQQYRTGDLMARATNDLQAIQRVAGGGILQFADSIITGGTTLIAMMTLVNWRLTLIAVLPFPLLAVMAFYLGQKINLAFRDSQAAFSRLNNKAQESITGVKVIKSLGQEQADIDDFNQQIDRTIEINRRVNRLDAMFDPITTLIIGLAYVATIVMGGSLVVHHVISIGNLVTFITYLSMMIWPIFAVGMLFNTMERGNASYDRVMRLINEHSQVVDLTDGVVSRPAGDLRFNLQGFGYPDATTLTLKNVQFNLKAGQTLGIVGRVGAGKTTVMRLLLRQFEHYQGQIDFGETNILDYKLDAYLPAIGYVPQDSFLFSESVRDNIAFAKPEATQAEIEQAVDLAGLTEQIANFEQGYETLVGEQGVSLSGGQRQRLAIARALLIQPELLILDDALSAVDAETESHILGNLHQLRTNKTTIIAAHRLSSVMQADEIIVLDHGEVTERGTHDELMAQKGWYRQMFDRQALEMKVREATDEK